MSLEVATLMHQLQPSNPVGSTDKKKQGDDHIRMIKLCLLNTWLNIQGVVNASHTELNWLVGVTSPVVHNNVKNIANGVGGLDLSARLANAQMPTDPSFVTVRLTSFVEADLTSAGGLQIGASTAFNLAMSYDRILARNNGAGSRLYLGDKGDGGVTIGNPLSGGAIVIFPGNGGGDETQIYHGAHVVFRTHPAGLYVCTDGAARAQFAADGSGAYWQSVIASVPSIITGTDDSAVLHNLLHMDPNGAVSAYYDGSLAHRSTSIGIELLGTANASADFTVNGTRKGLILCSPTDFSLLSEAGTAMRLFVRNAGDTAYNQGIKIDNAGAVYVGPAETPLATFVTTTVGYTISKYASSPTAMAATGSSAHGLGGQPDSWKASLVCTTTDLGYAVGDYVDIASVGFANQAQASVWANPTSVGWALASPLSSITIQNKGTGVSGTITPASWSIVVQATRFV